MDSVDACQTGGSGFVGAELADTTSVPWCLSRTATVAPQIGWCRWPDLPIGCARTLLVAARK